MVRDLHGSEQTQGRRPARRWRALKLAGALLLVLLAALVALSGLSNLFLPTGPAALDRLDPLDKARLSEARHAERVLGDVVWPGFGDSDIPLSVWNHDYAFLVGYPAPPADWSAVAGDDFERQTYYRQPARDPQNFAIQVGGWRVASMATKWETDSFLIAQFRKMMPGPLKPIFPYRLLIQPSEVQITGVLHEAFHVFEAERAPARFADAERAYPDSSRYWAADPAMREAWQAEIDLLDRAVRAQTDAEAAQLARQFLAQRAQRRDQQRLEPALVSYERRYEWLEGLAKYVELEIWEQAAAMPGYTAAPDLAADPDFKGYATFQSRWSQELGQMRRQAASEGDTRFYYTGMAQATLLDRLLPGWKARIFGEGAWPETLLAEAARAR